MYKEAKIHFQLGEIRIINSVQPVWKDLQENLSNDL